MRNNTFLPPLYSCILVVLLLISSGCVSSPSKDEKTTAVKSAPAWFFDPPEEDSKFRYFIGSGSSRQGDISEAEDNAVRDLMDAIVMYIGVEVTSDTTATAKASLDEFESDISQTVKTKSEARIAGFEIKEKLPYEKGDEITMYILAAYDKAELNKERIRIRKKFEERIEAISGPEQEGDALSAQGNFYEAAIKYLEAAGAAATSSVTNAEIKFERNINKAKEAIENINLIKLNDNILGLAGKALPEPFKLKVVNGTSETSSGVPNVVIEIGYMEMAKNGKLRSRSQKMKTNSDGTLFFEHPIPDFVGSENVKMALDLGAYLEPLSDVPAEYDEIVDGIDSLVVGKKVTFEFSTESNAKNIDTGIVILDIDENATLLSKNETSSSLLNTLTAEKFAIRNLSINPKEIMGKSDFDVIALLSEKYKSTVKRAMFGSARILSFSENSGKIFAKGSGTIQVVDLETEEILLTVVKNVNAMGSDKNTAQSSCFNKIGSEIGKEIKNKLR